MSLHSAECFTSAYSFCLSFVCASPLWRSCCQWASLISSVGMVTLGSLSLSHLPIKSSLCLVVVRLLYYFFLKDLTFLTFFWSADSSFQFLIILTLKVWPSSVSFSFPRPSKIFGKLSHKGCFLVYKLGIFKIHITAVYINSNFKYCKKHFQSFTTKQIKVAASPGTIKNSATVDLMVCGTVTLSLLFLSSSRGWECVYAYTILSYFAKVVPPHMKETEKHFRTWDYS